MPLDPTWKTPGEIFEEGIDAGDFIVKAHPKVPVRQFADRVPQNIVESMEGKYAKRLDTMFASIERRLGIADFGKSVRFVVTRVAGRDDLFKAVKAAPPGGPREDPKEPGSKGGKFYRNKKGRVVYGEQHPGSDYVEATDKEIVDHAREFITPTIFAGHNEESYKAILDSGHFNPNEIGVIEWFRENILQSKEVLGNLEGYKTVDDIMAQDFTFNKMKGAAAVVAFMKDLFMNKVEMQDENDNPFTPEETEKAFKGILKKYNDATKDPGVLEALKQNVIRHQVDKADASKSIKDLKSLTETSGILDRMIAPKNIQDAALEAMVLMRSQGLLFTVKSGSSIGKDASKRLKGQIHVNDDVLKAARDGDIDILSHCSPAQAIAFAIADALSAHQNPKTGDYDPNAFKYGDGLHVRTLGDLSENHGKQVKQVLEASNKTKMGEKLEKHYAERIAELGTQILTMLNAQHKGGDASIEKVMTGNTFEQLGDKETAKKIREKIQQSQEDIDRILKAADNDKLELPKGNMAKGVYSKERQLFPHQKKAVNWMVEAKRGILAHGPGLGKTTSAVTFVEHMKSQGNKDVQRGVMFLPPALIGQWIKEVGMYAPGSKILNLSNFPSEDRAEILKELGPEMDYVFVSKGLLTGNKEKDKKTGKEKVIEGGEEIDNKVIDSLNGLEGCAVFVDEVHQGGFKKVENSANKLTQKALEKSKYAFGMTATPVPNAAEDLFHLTDLFAPGTVGDLETWQGRLAHNEFDPKTGNLTITNMNDLKDLNERVKPRLLTGTFNDPEIKKTMAEALPPAPVLNDPGNVLMNLDVWPDKPPGQLSQHDYVEKAAPVMAHLRVEQLEAERIDAGEEPYKEGAKEMIVRLLTAMIQRKATISPALIDPEYTGRHPKIEKAGEIIRDHFRPDGQGGKDGKGIVVFSNFNQSFHLLKKELAEKHGIDPSLIGEIHSTSPDGDRDATQDAFNEGKLKIIMVGTLAGGAGLNLQKNSNHVLYIDAPFTASAKEQSIGRVYRTGQKEQTLISNLHVRDSYDDKLVDLIRNKGAIGEVLTANDFDQMLATLDIKNANLGGKPPKPPTAEERAKYKDLADKFQIDEGDLSEMTFDKSAKGVKGDTNDPNYYNYKVNAAAQKKLPKHMQTAFDRKTYEEKRDTEIAIKNAKETMGQYDLALNYYKKKGDQGNIKKYQKRKEDLQDLLDTASGKKMPKETKASKTGKKTKPEEGEEESGHAVPPLVEGLKPSSELPPVKKTKTLPYTASKKAHNSKRDEAAGAESEDFHLSGKDLQHLYEQYKTLKPKTAKEFMDAALGGTSLTPKQKLTVVKQVLTHFHNDKLLG